MILLWKIWNHSWSPRHIYIDLFDWIVSCFETVSLCKRDRVQLRREMFPGDNLESVDRDPCWSYFCPDIPSMARLAYQLTDFVHSDVDKPPELGPLWGGRPAYGWNSRVDSKGTNFAFIFLREALVMIGPIVHITRSSLIILGAIAGGLQNFRREQLRQILQSLCATNEIFTREQIWKHWVVLRVMVDRDILKTN